MVTIDTESLKYITQIFETIPLEIYQMYTNIHNEQSYYFKGSEADFTMLIDNITKEKGMQRVVKETCNDTYINVLKVSCLNNIHNIRIRTYSEGPNLFLVDVILLLKSDISQQNVLVYRYKVMEGDDGIKSIITHLNRSLPTRKLFAVTKNSNEIIIQQPVVINNQLTNPCLNISFDKVISIEVAEQNYEPIDILPSNMIIEIESNDLANRELVENLFATLARYEVFTKFTKTKTERKSDIIINKLENAIYPSSTG